QRGAHAQCPQLQASPRRSQGSWLLAPSMGQQVQRTRCLTNDRPGHSSVALGALERLVTKQRGDHVRVDALFQEMRREAVAKHVRAYGFLDTRCLGSLPQGLAKGAHGKAPPGPPGKQIWPL